MIDLLRHDVRSAFRSMFSIVDAVLLRALPFPNSDTLVLAGQVDRRTGEGSGDAAPANFLDWRARNRSLAGLAAYRGTVYALSSDDHPELLPGAMVSASFFDVLGVKPLLGRAFRAEDEGPGAPRVAIISAALWRQRFGGRSDALGQTARVNGEPHAIVGVLPPGIDFPDSQIWTPPHWRVPDDPLAAGEDPSAQRSHAYLFVLGRIRPEMSRAHAQQDLDRVAAALEQDYPDDNRNVGVRLTPLRENLVGDSRPTLMVLFAAVGGLLLIATLNVSGLLLARATGRRHEMAVRVALGASRSRIVLQLLTESLLLALVAGGCGIVVAMWLVPPLATLAPYMPGFNGELHADVNVLAFAFGTSVLAGIVFGLAPARQLVRTQVHDDLKQAGRGSTGSGQRRVRAALVATEIAMALVLLVGSGLTIKSFVRLQSVPAGFEPDRVLTLRVALAQGRYPGPAARASFWERAVPALSALPGIDAVGLTSRLPLSGGNSTRGFAVDRRMLTPPASADYRVVSPDYFRALGIRLLSGRTFREDDRENRPLVVIVSRSAANRYWPGADPLGRQLSIDGEHQLAVVGVVADVHHAALDAPIQPTIYVPYGQDPWASVTVVLKASVPPADVAAAARAAIWQVDKDQPIGAVRTMSEQMAVSMARRRFSVSLLTAFGTLAAALAAIGLYGVLAFLVSERRREIGVRMALGARPVDVIAGVMRQGLHLAAIGLAIGLPLAAGATRLINALLFGTSPADLPTYLAVTALLVLVTAMASLVPALRASRVDPIVALREE